MQRALNTIQMQGFSDDEEEINALLEHPEDPAADLDLILSWLFCWRMTSKHLMH
jgi:hypothetical protein